MEQNKNPLDFKNNFLENEKVIKFYNELDNLIYKYDKIKNQDEYNKFLAKYSLLMKEHLEYIQTLQDWRNKNG